MKEPETDKQKEFFNCLVEGAKKGEDGKLSFTTVPEAAEKAGINLQYAYKIVKEFKDYYIDRLQYKLLLHAPQAIQAIIDGMSFDGKQLGIKERLEASKDVLDRAGFVKKDKVELTVDTAKGVFILPAKERDKELGDGELKE